MSLNDVLTKQADLLRAKTGDNEKLTLGRMWDLTNALQWGQYNMLNGTSNQYRELKETTNFLEVTSASSKLTSVSSFHAKDMFTYSATITNNLSIPVSLQYYLYSMDFNTKSPIPLDPADPGTGLLGYSISGESNAILPGSVDLDTSISFRISSKTWFVRLEVVFSDGKTLDNASIKVKNERLYTGAVPGVWRPSLNDIIQGGGQISFFPYLASLPFLDFIGREV